MCYFLQHKDIDDLITNNDGDTIFSIANENNFVLPDAPRDTCNIKYDADEIRGATSVRSSSFSGSLNLLEEFKDDEPPLESRTFFQQKHRIIIN